MTMNCNNNNKQDNQYKKASTPAYIFVIVVIIICVLCCVIFGSFFFLIIIPFSLLSLSPSPPRPPPLQYVQLRYGTDRPSHQRQAIKKKSTNSIRRCTAA
mmetsp:Transcript_17932/g.20573  ORF Transcript_17932/g.20573 Transcript_17932/m.20573 type:complete len:100 (+) Transcript_17932:340-639(+)